MGLDLNASPRTSVFRKLVSLVKNDATIKRTLSRPAQFRAWTGEPQDGMAFSKEFAPCARFTPTCGPDQFWSPGATKGALYVHVDLLVSGTNADDLLNLWWAIVRAIYPAAPSAANANVQALQKAGAFSGLALFTMPVFDADPENLVFAGTGQIMIEVNNVLLTG